MKDTDKETGSTNEPTASHRVHYPQQQTTSQQHPPTSRESHPMQEQQPIEMSDRKESDLPISAPEVSGSAEGVGAVSTASSVGLSSQGTLAMEDVIAVVGPNGVAEYSTAATTSSTAFPSAATLNRFHQCPYAYTNAALELADEPHSSVVYNRCSSPPPPPVATLNPVSVISHCRRSLPSSSITINCTDASLPPSPLGPPPSLHAGVCLPLPSPEPPTGKLTNDDEAEEITWTDFDIRNHRFNASKLMHRLGNNARKRAKHFSLQEQVFTMFPLLDKLRNYNVKQDLIMDIIAGITISILHVPQGIAYSLLIGIPPVYGLYTSFFPVLIYAFLGTSMHISVGTMSVLDMMLSQIVRKYHNMNIDDYLFANGTLKGNLTMDPQPTELYSYHLGCTEVQLLMTLCILVGIFQIVMGVFQMGAISIILSDQLVSAFSCGAAFHVVVSQLPSVFEIKVPIKRDGPFSLFYSMADIVQYVHNTKTPAFLLSLSVFAALMIYKEVIDRHVKKRFPVPVPIDLIVIILATVASKYLHLSRDYSVNVMGEIPTGLPRPEMPRMDIVNRDVVQDAFVLSMISYAAALSLSKIYAKKHHYTVRANQEFFALGVSNFASSFFFCFPATASLSRASVMGELSRTQLSSLISCSILLQILLFLAPILTDLPKCAVGVIIICAQKSLLAQCQEFPKAFKLSKYEGMIWMVTFLGVICFGIDYGLMCGAVFSVFTIVMRFYHPKLRLLGQIPYTEIYLDIRQHRAAKEVPGVKVIQFTSPLFFINKDMFQESVLKRTLKNQVFKGALEGLDYGPVHALVLDCSAMSFIDSGGVEAIAEIANELQQRNIQVSLAALSPPVISMLTRMHFFEKTPYTLIFPAVHEAVLKSDSPMMARKLQI